MTCTCNAAIEPRYRDQPSGLHEPACALYDPQGDDALEACPLCGSDDLSSWAASEEREDEADLTGCNACGWEAALTPEGAQSRQEARELALLEREAALIDRWGITGLKGEGPLTQAQAALEASYDAHIEALMLEEEASA